MSINHWIFFSPPRIVSNTTPQRPPDMHREPRIEIHYCTRCRWLLRAAWYAQELLSTFGPQLGEVALLPATGGCFQVYCNGTLLWCRKREGRFPEAKDLKQRVRDHIAPGHSLGHSDR